MRITALPSIIQSPIGGNTHYVIYSSPTELGWWALVNVLYSVIDGNKLSREFYSRAGFAMWLEHYHPDTKIRLTSQWVSLQGDTTNLKSLATLFDRECRR